jgi:hypothetical protein
MQIKSSLWATSLLVLFSIRAPGQSPEFYHNHFTVGFGAGVPVGSDTSYLGAAPLLSLSYGYRFTRLLQADVGFQAIFGAAHNQNAVLTDAGPVQGGDHEYMLPLGGRFILPLGFKRLETSIGGGAMYLHYSETAPANSYYVSGCYSCTARAGWGGYGMANASWFFDADRHIHVGTTLQFVAASTDGQSVANIPASRTSDHWTNIFIEAGFDF